MALVKVLAPVLLAALHETVRSFGCCVAFHTVSFHNPPLKKNGDFNPAGGLWYDKVSLAVALCAQHLPDVDWVRKNLITTLEG